MIRYFLTVFSVKTTTTYITRFLNLRIKLIWHFLTKIVKFNSSFSIRGYEKKKKVNKFCQIAVHFKKFQNSAKMSRSVENILLQVNHVKHKKYEGTLYLMGERLAWMASHKNDTFSGMYFFSFQNYFQNYIRFFR